MYYSSSPIYFLVIAAMIVSAIIQWRLRSKFAKYAKIGLQSGLSGRQIAELMLTDHGISDVRVISTPGKLSDHYNPVDKT